MRPYSFKDLDIKLLITFNIIKKIFLIFYRGGGGGGHKDNFVCRWGGLLYSEAFFDNFTMGFGCV